MGSDCRLIVVSEALNQCNQPAWSSLGEFSTRAERIVGAKELWRLTEEDEREKSSLHCECGDLYSCMNMTCSIYVKRQALWSSRLVLKYEWLLRIRFLPAYRKGRRVAVEYGHASVLYGACLILGGY